MFDKVEPSAVVVAIGVLLLVVAFVTGMIAIWSYGTIQGQLAGTAGLCGAVGTLLALGGLIASDF